MVVVFTALISAHLYSPKESRYPPTPPLARPPPPLMWPNLARGTQGGWMPAFIAAEWGHVEVLRLLAAFGANMDAAIEVRSALGHTHAQACGHFPHCGAAPSSFIRCCSSV